jgi:hypothetical protein
VSIFPIAMFIQANFGIINSAPTCIAVNNSTIDGSKFNGVEKSTDEKSVIKNLFLNRNEKVNFILYKKSYIKSNIFVIIDSYGT